MRTLGEFNVCFNPETSSFVPIENKFAYMLSNMYFCTGKNRKYEETTWIVLCDCHCCRGLVLDKEDID